MGKDIFLDANTIPQRYCTIHHFVTITLRTLCPVIYHQLYCLLFQPVILNAHILYSQNPTPKIPKAQLAPALRRKCKHLVLWCL